MKTTRKQLQRQVLQFLMIIGFLCAANPLLAEVAAEPATAPGLWMAVWVETCSDGALTVDLAQTAVAGDAASLLTTEPLTSEASSADTAGAAEACTRSLVLVELTEVTSVDECMDAAVWSKELPGGMFSTSTP